MVTNGAVHEDASNGLASKRKIDDVTEVPSSDVDGKEASEIGAPTETQGEDLAVPALSTEVGEDVSDKTKASVTVEAESEVKDEISGRQSSSAENGNGIKHIAEEIGEEKGNETEAVETQRIEVEENGEEQLGTDPSSEEKPEILEDNALNVSPPAAKRHKSEE